MKTNTLIVVLFLLINYATTINILGIFPYEGKSHFMQFKKYLHELAYRGHNVTVISYFPEKNPPLNYHDIPIAEIKILEDDVPVMKSYVITFMTGYILASYGRANCRALVASPQVQELVKSKPKFDVVVVEQFNSDCALGIAYKLGAPVVGVTSHVLMPFHYNRLGIPSNPAFVPFHFLEGGTKPSLYQRVERIFFDTYFKLWYKFAQWNDRNTLIEQFGDVPPLEELAQDIKIMLLYHHFMLTGSKLLPSNVIEVGGYHVQDSKPLNGDLKKFVDEAEHGVIFISFGSMIKSSTMPTAQKQAIFDVIAELPQRIVWRWDDPTLQVDKNKVYISDWLPQVDILAHPKTLAFLSHAGMGGTTESVHYGVPMVAVPLFGDQPSNAFAIQESGLGVHLDFNHMNKDTLLDAFRKVLEPKFREQTKKVSKAWFDRPMSPIDTAVYWTEYVARNPDVNLRTAAADTPLYQHLYLDVAAISLILLVITVFALKAIFKLNSKQKIVAKTGFKAKKNTKRE